MSCSNQIHAMERKRINTLQKIWQERVGVNATFLFIIVNFWSCFLLLVDCQIFVCRDIRFAENQDSSCKLTSAFSVDESQAGKDKTRMAVCKNNSAIASLCNNYSHIVCNKPNGGANTGGSKGFLKSSSTKLQHREAVKGPLQKEKWM